MRGTDLPFWDYGGSTVISQDMMRLTPPESDRAGYVWNQKVPVRARTPPFFAYCGARAPARVRRASTSD